MSARMVHRGSKAQGSKSPAESCKSLEGFSAISPRVDSRGVNRQLQVLGLKALGVERGAQQLLDELGIGLAAAGFHHLTHQKTDGRILARSE